MTTPRTSIERIVEVLGGWPDHFGPAEKSHGESLLSVLRRDRVIDEVVFGLVVRYATHRGQFDALSVAIAADKDFTATATAYLSGAEQSRAFHENKLLLLERELLATPYARAKSGKSTQSSFMEELDKDPPDGGATVRHVLPFKPLAKKTR